MKPFASAVLAFAFVVVCFAADIPEKSRRVVNGKTVDLKPILEWEKLRRTLGANNPQLPPRPMPHWERVSGNRYEGTMDVLVTTAGKNTKKFIVVKNLPPPDKRFHNPYVSCLAFRTGQTNHVTPQKIAAAVYDHGREID